MLNKEQEAAVEEDGNCAVFAPPGSGKTTLLATKCARLLRVLPDDKQIIVAATFTREGAGVLRKRVHSILGQNGSKLQSRFIAGTFHSLSINQLKMAGINTPIVSPIDQSRYVNLAAARARYPKDNEELPTPSEHIETCKGSMVYDASKDDYGDLLKYYSEMLANDGFIDLFDVLTLCVEGMRDEDSPIKPYPALHMVLDETQDTDDVQFAWAREHHNAGTKITIVGDDDQTIYSWRRAAGYRGMRRFITYSGARTINLVHNYRSRPEIVKAASILIQHNVNREPKEILAHREPGGKLFIVPSHTLKQEAEAVARVIYRSEAVCGREREEEPGEYKTSKSVRDKSWAVIARSNAALRAVERSLSERKIPYTKNGKSIWQNDPVYGAICLLVAPTSLVALRSFMLGMGFKYDDTSRVISSIAPFSKNSAFRTSEALGSLNGDAGGLLNELLSSLDKLPGYVRASNPLFGLSNLQIVVMKCYAKLAPGVERDESMNWPEIRPEYYDSKIAELEENFQTLNQILKGNPPDWRAGFSRLIDKQSSLSEALVPAVQLLTMHSSKGMEFDNVWIVGAHVGAMPNVKRPKNMSLAEFSEEERRLFYVGMTRSKDNLYVSYVMKKEPSIYLMESNLEDLATWVRLPEAKRRKKGEPEPGSPDTLPDDVLDALK